MVSVNRQMPEALRRELDLSSTLENLEDRTAVLEKDFAAMLERTEELIQATERHADRQETELQVSFLELLLLLSWVQCDMAKQTIDIKDGFSGLMLVGCFSALS